eukprot:scaffold2557_cov139-Skeletonema_marinoi.AAC.20
MFSTDRSTWSLSGDACCETARISSVIRSLSGREWTLGREFRGAKRAFSPCFEQNNSVSSERQLNSTTTT